MSYSVVGVIGHIDHGKTTLVGVLTGVDTDTHPEEKRRGITIDLGFASFVVGEHEFALIDAPGHQKYIGNLLAGVSGIDIGLLVVACDQGIQAQTLEHAAILRTLGVTKLVVALSRIDLSDDQTRVELTEELEVFLADYGFTEIPIVPISSISGEGLETLKSTLCRFAREKERTAGSFFRMPIDRVFSVPGRGCVVAGTVWSGVASVGDTVQVAGSHEVRIRELEVHGRSVDQSKVGYRTAMNLTGISANELSRGDELVAKDSHQRSRRLLVELSMFPETPSLRCPATVQIHTATTACSARITGVKRLDPGSSNVVIVDTEVPVIATVNQHCLFRRPYPIGSFSGGRVLASFVDAPPGQTARIKELGHRLIGADTSQRLSAWVTYLGELDVDVARMELQLGIPQDACADTVKRCLSAGDVLMPLDGHLVGREAAKRARDYIIKVLKKQAEETDDAWSVQESVIERVRSTGTAPLIRWVIDQLVDEKVLVRLNNMVAVASDETVLSKKQKSRMQQIIELYQGVRTPPTTKEAAQQVESTIDSVGSLVRFATQQRILIDLGGGFIFSADMFCQLCRELRELFSENPEQSVSAIRDRWQLTRKHAIPLLEYCDRMSITSRKDDLRTAGPRLAAACMELSIE